MFTSPDLFSQSQEQTDDAVSDTEHTGLSEEELEVLKRAVTQTNEEML